MQVLVGLVAARGRATASPTCCSSAMIVYLLDSRLQLRRDRAARRVRAGASRRARADRPFADVALVRAAWRKRKSATESAEAVERLSRSGIGAIIAIEREVSLDEYVHSGSEMQAKVSADLLTTIFTPYSPLHDGAVIIRGDTIVGAACILPLSQASMIDRSLGTRHRAALGPDRRNGRARVRRVGGNGGDRRRIGRTAVARLRAGRRCATSSPGVPLRDVALEARSRRPVVTRAPARRSSPPLSLAAVYVATLAPGVTFWDAGEFIAAAHSARHSASAGHAAVRRSAQRVGEAPWLSAVRARRRISSRRVHRGRRRSHDAAGSRGATREPLAGLAAGICGGRDVHRLAERDRDGGLRGFAPALGRGDRRRGSCRPHRRRSLDSSHGVSPRARGAGAPERARRRAGRRTVGGEPARRWLRRPHGAGSLRRERRDSGSRTNVRVGDRRGIGADPPRRRASA